MTRTPIAEKLQYIRQAVTEPTKRKKFTPAQRRAVYAEFNGLCGCGCEEPLDGEAWDIDHVIELEFGGAHDISNWVPKIKAHHRLKTSANAPKVAKARRIRKRETEGAKPSRLKSAGKLQSPGFRKDITKKFNGAVVPRKEHA